jgi:hypothetical protein
MIQQSIDIKVPVHTAYNQLTQFEEYPRFMEEVQAVQQLDDTHLHWTTMMSNRPVEWDAEIIEQEPDRCIAWRNTSGPTNGGRVEVQSAGADASGAEASRVTFTLEAVLEQVPGSSAGNSEEELAQRLKLDLARLKDFIEARGAETGAWRGEIHDAQETAPDSNAQAPAGQGSAPSPAVAYAAGSEGFSGDEEPTAPVTSSTQLAAELRNDSAGAAAAGGSSLGDADMGADVGDTRAVPREGTRPAAGGTGTGAGAGTTAGPGNNAAKP